MPIYEYRCRKCGATFEMLQNMNDDNSTVQCPQCRTDRPERIISLFSSRSASSSGETCGPSSVS